MLRYLDGMMDFVPAGELHSFCKMENLDYLYTLSTKSGRRKKGKARSLFGGLFHKFKRKSESLELSCQYCFKEPKGLEL